VWSEVLDSDSWKLIGAFPDVTEDTWVDRPETRTAEDYKPLDQILRVMMLGGLIHQNSAMLGLENPKLLSFTQIKLN